MRHHRLSVFLALIIAACSCGRITAQTMYTTYSGFTVDETPVLPATERHPSLFFDSTAIASIQQRRTASEYSVMWNAISPLIASYKTKTAASMDINDRPRMAKYCAFGWIMNRDAAAKAKAIEALMIAYTNVPRTSTSADFDKPYDEIYRATWIQNYCEAYDWVQGELTHAQDSTIRSAIAAEAVILRSNMVSGADYAPRPHNHRSKPAYGLATAALTLSSDARAADWLRFALAQINTVTKYQFSSDGIYREGPHYYMYANVNAIPFLWQYKKVSGVDLFPAYQPAFEWPVLIRSQRGWMPNIEDSYVKPAPTHMVAAAYTKASTRLHQSAPLSSILQWNWKTTQFFTKDYTGATDDAVWDVDEFLLYDASIASVPPSIDPIVKLATGQVVFRSGWIATDPSPRYLIFHGVAAADNHDHPDELSYVMEANNTVLATDGGYGTDGSSDANRAWYTAPLSHNIVTVESSAPFDAAVNVTPADRHFCSTDWMTFSEKQASTAASNGVLRRGIAMIDKSYWFVYDRGTASSSAAYRLYLHGRGTMTRTDRSMTWDVPTDKYGSAARLFARIIGAGPMTMVDHADGYTSLFKDQIAQQYVEARQDHDTVLFGHVLMPASPGTPAPQIVDWSDDAALGCQVVTSASTSDYFFVKKTAANHVSGPMTTDAIFAAATQSGSVLTRWFVSEATSVQWNGQTMLTSSAPVTMSLSRQKDTLVVCAMDSVATPVSVSLAIGAEPESVTLNGIPLVFTAGAGGTVSFRIDRAGSIIIRLKRVSDVGVRTSAVPVGMSIDTVFPNPFNPSATIFYTLPRSERAKLEVYDVRGRSVATIVDGVVEAGTHACTWNGTGNPSGTYFFRLQTAAGEGHGKAMLIK